MASVTTGVLKPEYLRAAANAQMTHKNSTAIANRLTAMASHPSVAGTARSSEFHASAQQHLAIARNAVNSVRSMVPSPAETMTGNFTRSSNPSLN